MKYLTQIALILFSFLVLLTSANRLHSRLYKETMKTIPAISCSECPTDVKSGAFVSLECCSCVDGWEIVTVDKSLSYCAESSVLLDEIGLRLLTTFTGKLLEAYADSEERDEESGKKKAQEDSEIYVSQGTAQDLIRRNSGGELPVFARINNRDYRSGGSLRFNKITKDVTVGAAQEANFVKIRTLFPFETRFQSLNDKRARTTFEDKRGKHPGFRKISTRVNQNSAIEVAAVAFVPTFTVN